MASSRYTLLLCLACVILPASVFSTAEVTVKAPKLTAVCGFAEGEMTCSKITCTLDGGKSLSLKKGEKKLEINTVANESKTVKKADSVEYAIAKPKDAAGTYTCLAYSDDDGTADEKQSKSLTLGAKAVYAASSAGRAVTSLLLLPLLALPSLLL